MFIVKKHIILVIAITLISYMLYDNTDKIFSLLNYNKSRDTSAGDRFYKILFSKENPQQLFDLQNSNWQYLAKFEHASRSVIQTPAEETISVYSNLANDQEVPDILRQLAQYLDTMNSFSINDDITLGKKISQLESNSIYPYSAKEAVAIFALRNNKIKEATEVLNSLLNDPKCPVLIKANVQELLTTYESD